MPNKVLGFAIWWLYNDLYFPNNNICAAIVFT